MYTVWALTKPGEPPPPALRYRPSTGFLLVVVRARVGSPNTVSRPVQYRSGGGQFQELDFAYSPTVTEGPHGVQVTADELAMMTPPGCVMVSASIASAASTWSSIDYLRCGSTPVPSCGHGGLTKPRISPTGALCYHVVTCPTDTASSSNSHGPGEGEGEGEGREEKEKRTAPNRGMGGRAEVQGRTQGKLRVA